jgi:hypothetical protein
MPLSDALADLKRRVDNYQKVYEPIEDDHTSYIKLINLSAKVIANKVFGHLAHSICSYLMSVHIQPRPIYLSRCGHADGADELNVVANPADIFNTQLKRTTSRSDEPHIPYTLPLDCHLDERGRIFSKLLCEFLVKKCQTYWREHNELWNYIQDYLQLSPAVTPDWSRDEENTQNGSDNANGKAKQSQSTRRTKSHDEATAAHERKQQKAAAAEANNKQPTDRAPKPLMNKHTRLPLVVYTSTQPRAQETSSPIDGMSCHAALIMTLNHVISYHSSA